MSEHDASDEYDDDELDLATLANASWLPDGFLQVLVASANAHGTEFSVVLQMGGMLVSGMIESGRQHFQRVAGLVKQQNEALGVIWDSAAGDYPDVAQGEHDGIEDVERTKYIHLRDVLIVTPGAPPLVMTGVSWRGRLSAVDAWFLGSLTP